MIFGKEPVIFAVGSLLAIGSHFGFAALIAVPRRQCLGRLPVSSPLFVRIFGCFGDWQASWFKHNGHGRGVAWNGLWRR